MRQRLVAAFVGLAILTVALYGVPRAYFLADLVRSQEQERVDRTAEVIAIAVGDRLTSGDEVTTNFLDQLVSDDETLTVRLADGTTTSSTAAAESHQDDLTAQLETLGGGSLTLTHNGRAVGEDIAEALLPLVLIGLGLVVVAGFAGALIARRLARPFQDLAEAARGLGAGELHPQLPSYRVPEAQAIGEALRSSGARLDALLAHERDLATIASHELRTPVTALRLELEDLAAWPETPPAVAAELLRSVGELDRLALAVSSLLEQAKDQVADHDPEIDLDAVVAEVVTGFAPFPVQHHASGPLPTRLQPRAVARVLEFLVNQAQEQGAQQVQVQTHDQHNRYAVRVASDLGFTTPASDARWTAASELVASVGGQLTIDADRSALVYLPKRPVLGAAGAPGVDRTNTDA